ncbi:threonine-phosphate decarboxylase CobD [Bhargavaea beijingensis]|uniref:threonine-phosphate decarboxylase n=1 Tax=Bhargavaea beijingensis TaxID=426756 RepID=A0A1G7DRR4_9BACL|nr:threonine-phosphate decarboxylase CobD [Bhargavaea beijingensis]MCW1928926.1 threonine-phosphate decarboxylase CobD [Bhargavaea beijingensis]RSK30004.1 threonine-phosphate decarboxylase [Bhargavaea beijingensis]SDE54244.1 L-threonine O-3-phosphate decarboxylase [Bhargavaea beijingensis]
MQLPEHGANPLRLYDRLGMEVPDRVLDFSENVNPLGVPEGVRQIWPELLSELPHYPDPDGEPFRSAAADYHGVPAERVLAGNGAAELFAVIAERYRGRTALLIHPTFSEYKATLLSKGATCIDFVTDPAEPEFPEDRVIKKMEEADVLYLCNPNNPTGVRLSVEAIRRLAEHGLRTGCELVIDEAFMDFAGEKHSFIPHTEEFPHAVVVRSMTKMYGIAGIRLGYMIGSGERIAGHRKAVPHWNVNGMAARIGKLCFGEESFRRRTVRYCKEERRRLSEFLETAGCIVTGSETNYISFRPRQSDGLYREMLGQGIVLRHTENFLGMDGTWFRVGIKEREKMEILKEALAGWFGEHSSS